MIQKFQFFAEILKFCKFQKFLKFNESVVDVDESIQDLTGFCSFEPNSTKGLKPQVSYITSFRTTMHNEMVAPAYFDCAQHRLWRA